MKWAFKLYSSLVGLLNSELITSLMEAEPSTKALTEEVMGISRPRDLAFWLTANAVATPSTVVFLLKGFWQPSDTPKNKITRLF